MYSESEGNFFEAGFIDAFAQRETMVLQQGRHSMGPIIIACDPNTKFVAGDKGSDMTLVALCLIDGCFTVIIYYFFFIQ
jgi:hypothetical protein